MNPTQPCRTCQDLHRRIIAAARLDDRNTETSFREDWNIHLRSADDHRDTKTT